MLVLGLRIVQPLRMGDGLKEGSAPPELVERRWPALAAAAAAAAAASVGAALGAASGAALGAPGAAGAAATSAAGGDSTTGLQTAGG